MAKPSKKQIYLLIGVILAVGVIGLIINYQKKTPKVTSVPRLEELVYNVTPQRLLQDSGLVPLPNEVFSSGLGTESYRQITKMKTSSGNTFWVPVRSRNQNIVISFNDHQAELESFLGASAQSLVNQSISLYPIKTNLPFIITKDPSKQLMELRHINDGTHLRQQKIAQQIPNTYAVCYEIYPLPEEFTLITPLKLKFYDQGLICSYNLNLEQAEVISFAGLWGDTCQNKLLMMKNYYLPKDLMPQVNNKADFDSFLAQGKITPISATVIGIFH